MDCESLSLSPGSFALSPVLKHWKTYLFGLVLILVGLASRWSWCATSSSG